MCWTRNKFHYAVRKAKRLAANVKSRKLLEAAELGDVTLMNEMKRILGRKDNGQSVPESLDGKVTHDSILERFKECYEELYNSAGSDDAMTTIKAKLEDIINDDILNATHEIEKVTWEVVKTACSRMLPGKTDV